MAVTMNQGTDSQKRMLAVLAHPDDETFGMGGTLAKYARHGVDVQLICATRGEVGEIDEEFMQGFSDKAEVRENELRCASALLGLNAVHFLDYRDSGMPGSPDNRHPRALVAAPLDEVAAKITHYIREIRPQIVITFDPVGGYRHPDHIAIHQATVIAFHAAGDPERFPSDLPPYQPQKLYYHVFPHRFLRMAVRFMPLFGQDPSAFGRNKDIDLASIAREQFPIHTVVDFREVAKIRDQATACHASQGGQMFFRGPFGLARKLFSARDSYMQAYPEPARNRPNQDLFDGVDLHPADTVEQPVESITASHFSG
jgi:LmbE family N-acetylglucosaminyl deacetylase